jgi:hypothetical protein
MAFFQGEDVAVLAPSGRIVYGTFLSYARDGYVHVVTTDDGLVCLCHSSRVRGVAPYAVTVRIETPRECQARRRHLSRSYA